MTDALRLSVSKTKTFLDCKKKFQYAYIERLPRKDWDHHIFGKFCHKVLEDFHLAFINGSTEAFNTVMSKAYKDAIVEYDGKMTADMKKECWKIIDQYLRLITQDKKNNCLPNVLACEKSFDFAISDKVILNGMIDRVQLDADNVVHVCDYKTVKNKKYLKNDFFQLLTYAYVMINEDPSIQKIRASYILLRHDFEYITTEFSVPEILKIKDKYIDYANQIVEEKEYTPNPTPLCGYCDYLNACPEGKGRVFDKPVYGEVAW
jgi:CRISPR/Cas system-associated exonuclease Cas4 (RecB family)